MSQERAVQLRDAGMAPRKISAELGVDLATVRRWLDAAATVRRVVELYEAGATVRQVGAGLGVDEATVRRWLDAAGVIRRPPGRVPDPELPPKAVRARRARRAVYDDPRGPLPARARARILRALQRGATPMDAAAEVGVHVQRLWAAARWLPDWGAEVDAAIPCTAPVAYAGAFWGYQQGCRCAACRAANREYKRRYASTR